MLNLVKSEKLAVNVAKWFGGVLTLELSLIAYLYQKILM
jgi:hypothetical protein